jgi:hypothetical protein
MPSPWRTITVRMRRASHGQDNTPLRDGITEIPSAEAPGVHHKAEGFPWYV